MLGLIDWLLIGLYLGVVVATGISCRGRQDGVNDYFAAGGKMSGPVGTVLVGLSIAATLFSGISFLSIPSVTYQYGPTLLVGLVGFPLAWVVLRYWFFPKYFGENSYQPYQILQNRFGLPARNTAAIMFVLLRLGWMSALVYAPAIAIMGAADLDDHWFWPIVLTIGLTSTAYTVLGGIRGVIVTDAIQFLIIALGVIVTISYVAISMPVPADEAWEQLWSRYGWQRVDWSFDFTSPLTVWAVLIGLTTANFSSYIADQMSLQRYLAVGTPQAASRSFAINLIGVMVVLVLLIGLGMALNIWYSSVSVDGLPDEADKIFTYFASTQLPAGAAGLLLAAILSATMSSMTSGINALAAALCQDLGGKWTSGWEPGNQLKFAKIVSLIVGLLATCIAGLVDRLGSIFDISQSLLGVFLGPLMACMLVAVSRLKVPGLRIIVAMIAGCLVGWCVVFSSVASLWVAPISFGTAAILALLPWLRREQSIETFAHRGVV